MQRQRIANPTPEQLAKRIAARERAQVKRRQELAHLRQGYRRCPKRFGPVAVCGGFLELSPGPGGRLVATCPLCERFDRGLCRDCPRPVAGPVGHARYCAGCRAKARTAAVKLYALRHREEIHRRARVRNRDPKEQARRAAYYRCWRAANPLRAEAEKVRLRLQRRIARRQAKRAMGNRRAA